MFCSSTLRQASHVPRDKLTMDKSCIHTLPARRPAPITPVPTTRRYKRSVLTRRNAAVKQAGNQCHWTRIQFGQISVPCAQLRAHKIAPWNIRRNNTARKSVVSMSMIQSRHDNAWRHTFALHTGSHAPQNDVSVDGPHIRRWSHKIIILWWCLFSWRYNPFWLHFHSPVAGFSLLVFEVSWSHTATRHSR